MAQLNFGGVIENVVTREEFPLEKAREIALKAGFDCYYVYKNHEPLPVEL